MKYEIFFSVVGLWGLAIVVLAWMEEMFMYRLRTHAILGWVPPIAFFLVSLNGATSLEGPLTILIGGWFPCVLVSLFLTFIASGAKSFWPQIRELW